MVELKVNLPHSEWKFRMAGVYKITFDDGKFYIGCSENLRSRATDWRGIMGSPDRLKKNKSIGEAMISRILSGGAASLDILELCYAEEVKDREAFYLNKNRGNALMLSVPDCTWKPVLQFKEDGHFIKRHDSIKAAARFMNCKLGRIQRVLSNDRSAFKGMVFVYEGDHPDRRKRINRERSRKNYIRKTKAVKLHRCDSEGNILETYTTYSAAAKSVNGVSKNIARVVRGEQQTAYGFKWRLDTTPVAD